MGRKGLYTMIDDFFNAECAVLGSILVDPRCLPKVRDSLKVEDFSMLLNQQIYTAILELDKEGVCDPVALFNKVNQNGVICPANYFTELMDATPTAANVDLYVDIVKKQAGKRALTKLMEEATVKLQESDSADDAQDLLSRGLDAVRQQRFSNGIITPQQAALIFIDHRLKVDSGEQGGYVKTGYQDLDYLLGGGMVCGGMYILAARPGMGKTTMAINIAERVAETKNKPVLFVSLEMSTKEVQAKRVAKISGIPYNKVLMGKLDEYQCNKVNKALDQIKDSQIHFNGKETITTDEIYTLARCISGVCLVVIDYLGIISPGVSIKKSRYEYTSEISGAIKRMARKLEVPVLTLAQLNRETEGRKDHLPQLSDLRDSGAIEQDADGIIFLHREAYYRPEEKSDIETLSVIVAKNRHGSTGKCELQFAVANGKIVSESKDPRQRWGEMIKRGEWP